jgi:hypothetical protein
MLLKSKWFIIIPSLFIGFLMGLIVFARFQHKDKPTSITDTNSTAFSHQDWELYTEETQKYSLYHPKEMQFSHPYIQKNNIVAGYISGDTSQAENEYIEFSIEISEKTPEALFKEHMLIVDPKYSEPQQISVAGQSVTMYTNYGGEAGAFPTHFFALQRNNLTYLIEITTFSQWGIAEQMLSTFRFIE